MGEISEMILDGILCEGCGVYIGHECGYPRRCPGCKPNAPSPDKMNCPTCGKRIKKAGLKMHNRVVHRIIE